MPCGAFAYDLVLLDVMLPKLDIEFLQTATSEQSNTVLLLTALDTSTNIVMGLDAGADDYLVKPTMSYWLGCGLCSVEKVRLSPQ